MGNTVLAALRVVIALAFAGSLFVQGVMVPLIWFDLADAPMSVRVPLVLIIVGVIVTLQVVALCVWKLLSLIRTGTVFSDASFRFVDITIGSITAASVLTFALAVVLAPGEAVAPGLVGLICGFSLVIAGVALLVLVLRTLLTQAGARDREAQHLQSELDEVI